MCPMRSVSTSVRLCFASSPSLVATENRASLPNVSSCRRNRPVKADVSPMYASGGASPGYQIRYTPLAGTAASRRNPISKCLHSMTCHIWRRWSLERRRLECHTRDEKSSPRLHSRGWCDIHSVVDYRPPVAGRLPTRVGLKGVVEFEEPHRPKHRNL